MTLGKKPEEQVLKEWTVDCIRLRGGTKLDEDAAEKRRVSGHAGARYWTKDAMRTLAKALQESNFAGELVGIEKSAKDSAKFMMYIIAAFDPRRLVSIHDWMREMNRLQEMTALWVASWTSIDYMFEYVKSEYRKATGKHAEEPRSGIDGVRQRMLARRPWKRTP